MTDEPSAASPEEAAAKREAPVESADSATTTAAPAQGSSGSAPTAEPSSLSANPESGTDSAADPGSPAEAPTSATELTDSAPPNGEASNQPDVRPRRPKIQVGSRRGDSKEPLPSKPMLAQPKPIADQVVEKPVETEEQVQAPAGQAKVAAPTRRTPLSADEQQALEEAIGDVSIDDLVSGESTDRAAQEIELDSRRRGQVVRIHGDNIFFSIGGRNEGVASVRQFKEPPAVGDDMEVVVKSFQPDDGLYELAIPGAAVSVTDWSDLTEGAVVEGRITGANTGGLECMVNQIRGFIPSSQIALFRVQDFAEYIGQKLDCVVTEVNPRRRNLVLSHRALLERQKEEARAKLLEQLEPGSIVEGVVRSLRDFGAFVDLGGVDGLIHISQLSWDRVNHPSDVLSEGQKVRVRVEKVNTQTGKIGLSYRELLEHPWAKVEDELTVGSTVRGPVTRIAKFGAFVKLAAGVEGLIHISEMAHGRVRQVSDVVSEGEEIDVKILSIDTEAQRIALSLKATQPEPEKPEGAEPDPEPTATARRKPKGPLKGGVDRPSGGEEFGLKW